MPDWRPVQSILPIEFYYPRPGTKEPFAIIRWVDLRLEGEPVSRWRAVTYQEPRRLIGDGYYQELDDAATACHRLAITSTVPAVLDVQRR
ncbi:hypothetical protein [Herbiconiux sp.]|uniref:hypothetical protein n=1 Tax=Herbiconiux sp. TaxID=1871186 RepID=UPI0025BBDFC2|nr:hypothetical protein [Herbiconiux sp.]